MNITWKYVNLSKTRDLWVVQNCTQQWYCNWSKRDSQTRGTTKTPTGRHLTAIVPCLGLWMAVFIESRSADRSSIYVYKQARRMTTSNNQDQYRDHVNITWKGINISKTKDLWMVQNCTEQCNRYWSKRGSQTRVRPKHPRDDIWLPSSRVGL